MNGGSSVDVKYLDVIRDPFLRLTFPHHPFLMSGFAWSAWKPTCHFLMTWFFLLFLNYDRMKICLTIRKSCFCWKFFLS